jgi:hypothetical protein
MRGSRGDEHAVTLSLHAARRTGANLLQQCENVLLDAELVKVCTDVCNDVVDDGAVDGRLTDDRRGSRTERGVAREGGQAGRQLLGSHDRGSKSDDARQRGREYRRQSCLTSRREETSRRGSGAGVV